MKRPGNSSIWLSDCTGSPEGLPFALQATKPQGIIVVKTTTAARRILDLNSMVINEIRLLGSRCGPFPPAIQALEKRQIRVSPLISQIFAFDDAVAGFHAATQKGSLKILLTNVILIDMTAVLANKYINMILNKHSRHMAGALKIFIALSLALGLLALCNRPAFAAKEPENQAAEEAMEGMVKFSGGLMSVQARDSRPEELMKEAGGKVCD